MERPLILLTNDDGIDAVGLWAVAEAIAPIAEVLIVAPDRQWSGAGRCMPHTVTGAYQRVHRNVNGNSIEAYSIDASPALAVEHGILEFAPRRPDLVISGVNYGANVSIDVTISGTVGAALEASSFGIPSVALSLEMDAAYYLVGDSGASYEATQAYSRRIAETLLAHGMPHGIDVLNVNLPSDATPETPWRRTTLSRFRYFVPMAPDRASKHARPRYRIIKDPTATEIDSDLYALLVDRQVSITPLSLDLTVSTGDYLFEQDVTGELIDHQIIPSPAFSMLENKLEPVPVTATAQHPRDISRT